MKAAGAAVVSVALLLTACAGDDGGEATLSHAPASTRPAPSLLAGTTVPPAVVNVGPTTTRPRGTTTTTSRPPTTAGSPTAPAPTTPAPPARIAPAAPGTYRYDTAGQTSYPGFGGATSPYPAVTTLVVDRPVGSMQHATRDLRDAARNGPVIESFFDYRADGVYLNSLKLNVTVFVFFNAQEYRPAAPTLLLPTGVRPGYAQEIPLPTSVSAARLVVDVLREERLTIGGQPVDTIVARLTASLSGQFNASMELTVWLAPSTGVWVKEHSVSSASAPDGTPVYSGQYDAILQRLSPA